jgi:uroporphyrinogen-III decarboxylase
LVFFKTIIKNNYDLVLVDDMFSENKVIPREEMLKQCSTKIIQRVNGTRIPVVIMVTKNNKSLEKKYLKYGYVGYIINIYSTTTFSNYINTSTTNQITTIIT